MSGFDKKDASIVKTLLILKPSKVKGKNLIIL